MKILGIYGGYMNHDPGICYLVNGEIIFAYNEERPRRLKAHTIELRSKMDSTTARFKEYGDSEPWETSFPVDCLRMMDEKFDVRLGDLDYIVTTSPVSIELKDWFDENQISYDRLKVVNHHTSHCAGAYYTSGFKEKTFILSYDAGGMTDGLAHENTFGKTFVGYNDSMKMINNKLSVKLFLKNY